MDFDLNRAFASSDKGPVTIVFGTDHYFKLIAEWIRHARRAGCRHYRIVCLDDKLSARLCERGEETSVVSYHEIFPDAPQINISPDIEWKEQIPMRNMIWRLRVWLFAYLVEHGIDFIHSDSDSFWMKDPRPWLRQHLTYDLLISQGPGYRWDSLSHSYIHRITSPYDFNLCPGFFLARGNRRTQSYFKKVVALQAEEPTKNDQYWMNEMLVRDSKKHWNPQKPIRIPFYRTQESIFWAIFGKFLSNPIPRRLSQGLLKLFPRHHFVISPEIIRGRFSRGLTVGIIPMALVIRRINQNVWHCEDLTPHKKNLVSHLQENKTKFIG